MTKGGPVLEVLVLWAPTVHKRQVFCEDGYSPPQERRDRKSE